MNITVWNEYRHELSEEKVGKVYPKGIHGCIADFLTAAGHNVTTATLDMPEHGLTQEVLDNTDVLFWWGHMAHGEVKDEIVDRVYKRVMEGMGMVVLHSGHASKIFQKLMGTNSGFLRWRENDEKEIMWNVNPSHPIMKGIGANIVIPQEVLDWRQNYVLLVLEGKTATLSYSNLLAEKIATYVFSVDDSK